MKDTRKNTKNNQRRICKELIEPVKEFIPYHYSEQVLEKLRREGIEGSDNYLKRKIQQVKVLKNYDVIVAKAIRQVAEDYKKIVEG